MKFKKFNSFGFSEAVAVNRVLKSKTLSGFYGNWGEKFEGGREVVGFERECEEYFKTKHAITFNSLASGLSAAIGAIGIEPGDEVILPPWTMSATAAAVLHWGGIPIFADINSNTYCLDPKSVELNLSPKTKAIIAVDIFGQSANIEELSSIAKKYDLRLISDSAQAIGAMRNGNMCGTMADIGGLSLNYHKHIHSGEGGIMLTNDDNLALRLKLIRNHAESVVADIPFEVNLANMVGHNYRMSELHAAIGRAQLKKLNRIIARRQEEVFDLKKKLSVFDEIDLPYTEQNNSHVYYMFAMQFKESRFRIKKHEFVNQLSHLGIPGLSSEYVNLHLLPLFQNKIALGSKGFPWTYEYSRKNINYLKGICPIAENLQSNTYFSFYINDFALNSSHIKFIRSTFEKVIKEYSK